MLEYFKKMYLNPEKKNKFWTITFSVVLGYITFSGIDYNLLEARFEFH